MWNWNQFNAFRQSSDNRVSKQARFASVACLIKVCANMATSPDGRNISLQLSNRAQTKFFWRKFRQFKYFSSFFLLCNTTTSVDHKVRLAMFTFGVEFPNGLSSGVLECFGHQLDLWFIAISVRLAFNCFKLTPQVVSKCYRHRAKNVTKQVFIFSVITNARRW